MAVRRICRGIGLGLLVSLFGVVAGCIVTPPGGGGDDPPPGQDTDSTTDDGSADPSGDNNGGQGGATDGTDGEEGGGNPSDSDEPGTSDAVDDGGDVDPSEQDPSDSGDPGLPDCGSRSVRSIPAPGRYEWIIEFEQQVEGSGGLADYLAAASLSDCLDEEFGAIRTPLTVGAGGVVEEDGEGETHFEVLEGCLVLIGDDPLPPDLDEPDDPDGLCGEDAFPIGTIIPQIPDLGFDIDLPFDSEYVCVRVLQRDSCFQCSQAGDEWLMDSEVTVSYTALGSISLSVPDPCAEELTTINVVEGETAVVTTFSTFTLRRAE